MQPAHLPELLTAIQEASLLGVLALEQLNYARQERRVICTQDADFLILATRTSDHAGITYGCKQVRSIGQIIAWLDLIDEVITADEI